jgi:glycosyltransferase involved in cell wall biosynthesis
MDLEAVSSLGKLLRQWRPDVIQAHGGEPYKYAAMANLRCGWPVIYRRIGAAPNWIRRGPRRFAHSLLMRRASRIVAVADAVRHETIELFGVDASRIVTIPNGVSVDRIQPLRGRSHTRRILGIPADAVVLLSLGALTWEKDPMTQLDVAAMAVRNRHDAVHLFVGDGPMRREIEKRIAELALSPQCRVIGSRSDVGDVLAASDVLLFASRADGMEGMPATVIEAGMAGLPVAAYSIVGIPEVVVHGVTGLLARHGDTHELSGHVTRLLVESNLRLTMGEAARRLCRPRFDIKSIAPRYLALYSQAIQEAEDRQGRGAFRRQTI